MMLHSVFWRLISFVCVLCFLGGCVPSVIGATATTTGIAIAQERTVGNAIDDMTIWTQIKSDMLKTEVDSLFAGIDVKVTEGRVLLTGTTQDPHVRVEAARIAWNQNRVREVINEIIVTHKKEDKEEIKAYGVDSWITAQVKGKLLLNKDVHSINYTVETVNKVVYLMGIAQNRQELESALYLARTIRQVQRVVSHVRLKDDPLRQVRPVTTSSATR